MPVSLDKSDSERQRIQKYLQDAQTANTTQYRVIESDLEFSGGEQFTPGEITQRGTDSRPCIVVNYTRPIIDRIVNPLRLNPIGIRVGTPDPALTELLTSIFRDIEVSSRAREAYEIAYEHAVTAGIGWIKISTEYCGDTSNDQRISFEIVDNPTTCHLDPYHKRVDGSDARWGFSMNYLPNDEARERFGAEAVGTGNFGVDLYEHWNVPENSAADMLFYEVIETKKSRAFGSQYQNGYMDVEEGTEGSREITEKKVKCSRFVGNVLVSETELEIPYIPLIPVYGDRLYESKSNGVKWGGIVHKVKDSQRMANFYASNELELAALAPKVPFIGVEGQFEGHEDEWQQANTRNKPFLEYTPVSLNGTPAPPPQRADNQAQTGGLIQQRIQSQQDINRIAGVFDNMLGGLEGSREAGVSAMLRQSQGELPTAQYLTNLEQSVAQAGRVILRLAAIIYDTNRLMGLRDDKDGRQVQELNLSEILTPQLLDIIELDVTSGPALESRRKESINTIVSLAQGNPQMLQGVADILVRNSDAPGSQEIADRLEKMLPPELQDNPDQPDPEAIQALQQAQATIQEQEKAIETLNGVVNQLQAALINKQKDRELEMAKIAAKGEIDLAKERIKQEGEDDRQNAQLEADAMSDVMDLATTVANNKTETPEVEFDADTQFVSRVPGPVGELTVDVEDPDVQ